MTSPATLKLALVGCGDIAGAYLDAAPQTRRCRIVQVMDLNPELATARGATYGVPQTTRFEDVLANGEADAVVLAVPHYLHAPLTLRALESGKHVMCDKPIATSLADAARMIETAARLRRKLTINYVMRFSAKARLARTLLERRLLGDIFALTVIAAGVKPADYWQQGWAKVTRTDWRKSKAQSGGGITLMNCSHYLDLLFHLTGLAATDVSGRKGTFNSPPDVEVEDLAAGTMRLTNGGILTLLASSCYPGGLTHTLSLVGRKGQMDYDTAKGDTLRVFLTESADPAIRAHEWVTLPVPPATEPTGYAGLMDAFAAAVQDGAPVPVDPRDALHTLACVQALYGEVREIPPGYGAAASERNEPPSIEHRTSNAER